MAFSLLGSLVGFLAGALFALNLGGAAGRYYPLLSAAAGGVAVYLFVRRASAGGRGAGRRRREYAFAESLVAAGRWEDAVAAFELAVGEHPDDFVPYLRIARIERDELGRPDRSESWFKRALRDADPGPAMERLVLRELVELHRRSGQQRRAAPELARLAERWPETADGAWARAELEALKRSMVSEEP